MTKENILRHLNLILETDINTLKRFNTPHEALENEIEALKGAIEFIEQESILNEIQEEINSPNRGTCDYFIVDRIEEIIDKYKGESEVQDADSN